MARPPTLPAEEKVQIGFRRLSENSGAPVRNLDHISVMVLPNRRPVHVMLGSLIFRDMGSFTSRCHVVKGGFVAEGCRGAHVSGGLSYRRSKGIVDQVAPASVRAAAHDIACRAFEVHVLAVGTCAID
jgi:hypothetical protein